MPTSKRRKGESESPSDVVFNGFVRLDGVALGSFVERLESSPEQLAQLVFRCAESGFFDRREYHASFKRLCAEKNASGWAALPAEILTQVFGLLEKLSDLRACSATCCSWNAIAFPTCRRLPSKFRQYRVGPGRPGPTFRVGLLPSIVSSCPMLRHISLFGSLDICLTKLEHLEWLDLNANSGSTNLDSVLPGLTRLTCLSVSHVTSNDPLFDAIADCSGLRQLVLGDLRSLKIRSLPGGLVSLGVESGDLRGHLLTSLTGLTRLELLGKLYESGDLALLTALRYLECDSGAADVVLRLPRLETLKLFGRAATFCAVFPTQLSELALDELYWIANLPEMTNLRRLSLGSDQSDGNRTIRALALLTNLVELELMWRDGSYDSDSSDYSPVHGAVDCSPLRALPHLTRLVTCSITMNRGLEHLTQLRRLELEDLRESIVGPVRSALSSVSITQIEYPVRRRQHLWLKCKECACSG
eukprot:TRINITY_DN1407_c2_g1_i1.p1 TRINITY_DN1407_c2_g1~~TRINITY_DN1407_c2_g1_i1.p1  ORF type:complete len:473 (-),score=42.80 TRINITY_DN1407_c2_g1_i1:5-1423(-)